MSESVRDPKADPKRGDVVFAPGLGQVEVVGDRGVLLTTQNIVDSLLGYGRRRVSREFWRACMARPDARVIHAAGGGR